MKTGLTSFLEEYPWSVSLPTSHNLQVCVVRFVKNVLPFGVTLVVLNGRFPTQKGKVQNLSKERYLMHDTPSKKRINILGNK